MNVESNLIFSEKLIPKLTGAHDVLRPFKLISFKGWKDSMFSKNEAARASKKQEKESSIIRRIICATLV